MYDELELDKLGDRKTALFLITSDTDSTFNFLISMIYTQLFNLLCDKADDVYGGKLPVHVRCLIDECANIGQIPQLEKLVATIRSREISACLVLQTRSQLKAILTFILKGRCFYAASDEHYLSAQPAQKFDQSFFLMGGGSEWKQFSRRSRIGSNRC